MIWLPLSYANHLFWHTLFSRFSFGSTSEIIEFALFNFAFLFTTRKSRINKRHANINDFIVLYY